MWFDVRTEDASDFQTVVDGYLEMHWLTYSDQRASAEQMEGSEMMKIPKSRIEQLKSVL